MRHRLFAAALAFSLYGCGFVDDVALVGPYRVVAVDIDEQRELCWSYNSRDCLTDGLPGPMVYAAGFDDRYLVIAIHPWSDDGKADTPPPSKASHFFYVIRDLDKEAEAGKTGFHGAPYTAIKGPFDQRAFDAEKARLHLPDFSKHF